MLTQPYNSWPWSPLSNPTEINPFNLTLKYSRADNATESVNCLMNSLTFQNCKCLFQLKKQLSSDNLCFS